MAGEHDPHGPPGAAGAKPEAARARGGPAHAGHDHALHDHGDHDHGAAGHGHAAHGHADHDHPDHDHPDHDHDDHAGHSDAHGPGGHAHTDHAHAGHSHAGHAHAAPTSLRAFAIGAAVNFAFVIVEVVLGLYAGSLALVADAGHNLSDVLGLVLAWGAAWLSRRAPTRKRTFGFGRSSILAALANAAILLLGTGAIIVEALGRFSDPEPVQTGLVMAVAAVGIVVNFGTALLFMAGRKNDLNVRGAFLHMMADAGVSVGVVIAAGVIALTGWLWIDPVVSLAIAVVIIAGTWGLARDSMDLAMDAVPNGIDRQAVERFLAGRPGVREVHDLHIWGLSTTEVALTAHLVRPGAGQDDSFLFETCAGLKARFGIGHAALQVEGGTLPCPLAPDHVI